MTLRTPLLLTQAAAVIMLIPAGHGQVAQGCPGCEGNSASHYVETPCPDGARAFIRVDVYRDDGVCELFMAPPYASGCIRSEDCKPFVVSRIGKKDGVLDPVFIQGKHYVVECGEDRTIHFGGSCGVELDVVLWCTACPSEEE